MGTSLTLEFWERFAVLLAAATGVTFVLTAAFDAVAVRLLRRRASRTSAQPPNRTRSTPSGLSRDGSSYRARTDHPRASSSAMSAAQPSMAAQSR